MRVVTAAVFVLAALITLSVAMGHGGPSFGNGTVATVHQAP